MAQGLIREVMPEITVGEEEVNAIKGGKNNGRRIRDFFKGIKREEA